MRILGSDFDGTLTHKLGEETYASIRAWREAGNKFGIVSGRPMSFAAEIRANYPRMELDFFVGFNGAAVTDGCGNLIYEKKCTEVSATDLTADLLALDCPFVHVNSDAYYCVVAKEENTPSWIDPRDIVTPDRLPVLPYFHQISTQFPDDEASAAAVTAKLREKYGHILNPLQNGT